MEIYLAGGATGNNNHIWRDNSKTNPEKPMEIFLAGTHAENNRANSEGDFKQKISILESFYYMNDWMLPYIKEHWNFLLDSGAFTFMSDKKIRTALIGMNISKNTRISSTRIKLNFLLSWILMPLWD